MRALLPLVLVPLPALAEVAVTDASGVAHVFDAPRARPLCGPVECLAALAGLGLRPHSVWGDWFSDPETGALVHYWGEAAGEIVVVPDAGSDLEPMAAADPDVIFLYEWERAALETVAPLYAMHYDLADPIAQGKADMAGMAAILGMPAEAAQARIDALVARVEAYEALSPRDRSVLILMGFGAAETGQFNVMGSACAFLARVAPCPEGTPAEYYATLGLEGLVALNPAVLLVEQEMETDEADARAAAAFAALEGEALWSEVAAVRAGAIHAMPMVFRPTHLTSAAEWLDRYMPLIYPETFPAPLTDAQVAAALSE